MASFRLPANGPFHLHATVRILQRLPTNRVDVLLDGRYHRVLPASTGPVLLVTENAGTIAAPDLLVHCHEQVSAVDRQRLIATLSAMLGLHMDPTPFEQLAPALRGMRPPRFPTLFETFANVIPFQQVSLAAGAAIVVRLVERFGATLTVAGRTHYAFPGPAAIAGCHLADLREVGLSRTKAQALQSIAGSIQRGELSEGQLHGPDAMDRLQKMPGIGPWSAALVLLRGMQRMDVFPQKDGGVAKGLAQLLDIPAAQVESFAEGLGAHRGYLYYYSLAAKLLAQGLI